MAISRMQQPRQMYGLGSFVKKGVRKLTKPITKVAKKIVPKEIAGIMRTAAPFLPPGYREAAYLLGTAKQTGRISPVDLALTAAPTFFSKTNVGRNIAGRVGGIKVPFTGEKTLGEILVGAPEKTARGDLTIRERFTDDLDAFGVTERVLPGMGDERVISDATSGIFGKGGEMFQLGKGDVGIFDTKAGQTLFGKKKDDGTFGPSISKIAGIGISTLSLIQDSETPEEAGNKLAAATGNSDDYERGYNLFSQLTPELFRVPERFRMQAQGGGLMRTNYALGSDDNPNAEPINPFKPKPIGPILPEEDKPFRPRPLKPLKISEEDKEPMLMAGSDRYQRILEQLINELEDQLGRPLTDAEYDMAGRMAYDIFSSDNYLAEGGRVNYALGTKPTAEESGLGGLPIEADMRYTGGFMPYGAKEKADDVPARLSKNEFVFTADAVRAAGGGSVNEGAKKMYATMKQLEAKPEAKGMRA